MVDARSAGALLMVAAMLAAVPARAAERAPDLFPAYRLGYVAGGALALAGVGFGLAARADALQAANATSARQGSAALAAARDHAATSNLCYAMAGASALYALVLEFLPRPAADRASLAFHF